jgi:hypothetical protein
MLGLGCLFTKTAHRARRNLMTKVLNITDRLKNKKQLRQADIYQRRLEALQKVVYCSSCHLRCAMCGSYLEESRSADSGVSKAVDFTLCESCRIEFKDFLKLSRGRGKSDIVWHNKEWVRLWTTWLDFQHAINGFRDSDEFKEIPRESDS